MTSLETSSHRRPAGLPPPALEINSGRLRDGGVLLLEGAGGYVCLGLGGGATLARFAFEDAGEMPFFDRCRAAATALDDGDLAKAEAVGLKRPVSRRTELPLRRLAVADALFKAGFDPNQPRDEDGRWTDTGGSSGRGSGDGNSASHFGAGVAGAAAGYSEEAWQAARTAGSLISRLSPALFQALKPIATALLEPAVAAPAAFFGLTLIPSNRSLISEGSLPQRPDVKYHFDRGTGVLQLGRDGQEIFRGQADADGIFRTEDGVEVARRHDDAVVLDPAAVFEAEASRTRGKPSESAVGVGQIAGPNDTATNIDRETAGQWSRDRPKICPDKTLDRPGSGRSARAIAYQAYVSKLINPENPLPPGFAVELWDPVEKKYVSFDECYNDSGWMAEAKGEGLEDLFRGRNRYAWDEGVERKFIMQAEAQVRAAKGRPIVWHFANEQIAAHFREIFAERFPSIIVVWTPMTVDAP